MPLSISAATVKYAVRVAVILAFALAALGFASAARAEDPIVGVWAGKLAQPDTEPFETEVTFVSPKGGVSRYPSFPCGGVLSGGRRGDSYEYEEAISWGGPEEVDPGCLSGSVSITLAGDKMNLTWTGDYNGQRYEASGELTRQRGAAN